MTLVVGPNLSVDQTVAVPVLRVGEIHRVPEVLKLAGGKGTNLARALRILGGEPLLVGFAGGPVGGQLRAYLEADSLPHHLVPSVGETRVCFSIADVATGVQTEFYEAGPVVSAEEVAALLRVVRDVLPGQRWVAITGSLPRGGPVDGGPVDGGPADLYAQLIRLARAHGARTLLDAKGDVLAAGIAAGPDLLKINRAELEGSLGRRVPTPAEVATAAADVIRMDDGGAAMITLGAEGAVVVARKGRWLVTPPEDLPIVSPVGSGDSTAAGLLTGLERGLPLVAAARLGVAAGTASALHLGAARFARDEVEALLPRCGVVPLQAE
jgi:1-phosphofructokinase family hexose kinase